MRLSTAAESENTRIMRLRRLLTAASFAIAWTMLVTGLAVASGRAPVQIYYVPVPEDQALAALQALYPSAAECGGNSQTAAYPVTSYIAIATSVPGTVIVYDHWEDGYEYDLSNPIQSSTEVWGDGDLENGWLSDYPSDWLDGGAIVLTSRISERAALDYDGGDRIAADGNIAVTRAVWASGSDAQMAGSVVMAPLRDWGTRYVMPVGQDEYLYTPASQPFELTAAAIMATQDGTTVTVDADADGTPDSEIVLQQGESIYVTDLSVGASVDSTAPVQVTLITGDRCDSYETRWYALVPERLWSNTYFNPVGQAPDVINGPTETQVYVHNPSVVQAISVTVATSSTVTPPVFISVTSTQVITMPMDAGARVGSLDGSPFQAIVAVDAWPGAGNDADWGMTLVPEQLLTAYALVGLGMGHDPTTDAEPDENSSPVWVMPVLGDGVIGPVDVCVDFNNDNLPGQPDGNGFYTDLVLELDEFENARVYDPDGDQSSIFIYACDPATGNPPDVRISAAWGHLPADASAARRGLVMGTVVPPLPLIAASKSVTVALDRNSDGVINPGDSVEYRVKVQNSSRITVTDIHISDTIPLHTIYISDTTAIDDGAGPVKLADDLIGTRFPLDEGGTVLAELPAHAAFTVTYQVHVDDPFTGGEAPITNTAYVTTVGKSYEVGIASEVFDTSIAFLHTASQDFVAEAGTVVTHTYVLTNTGIDPLTSITVTDDGCAPVVFNEGDADSNGALNLGESWRFDCSTEVLRTITNTATASAQNQLSRVYTRTSSTFINTGFAWMPPILRQGYTPCPPPVGCLLRGGLMGMDIDTKTNRLYVTSRAGAGSADQLLMVDADTAEILDYVETGEGSDPWGVVVNAKTGRVYVGLEGTGEVAVYDGETLDELARLNVDNVIADNETALPGRMAILPELDTVFVTVRGDNRIVIIRGLKLAASIEAGGVGPWGIAADTERNLVYVSHRDSHNFSILKRHGDEWVAKSGPAFPPARDFLALDYVAPGDAKSAGILYTLWSNPQSTWFLGLWQPDEDAVDWTYRGDVVLNSHGDISGPYAGGDGLGVNPATGNIYTANTGDDKLTVIRGDGARYLDFIRVQNDPFAMVVNPISSVIYIGLRARGALVTIIDRTYP